jgi:hypothetical protein
MMEDERNAACSLDEYVRNVYKILLGKLEGKRQLGRGRCRWDSKYCIVLRWTF